MPPKLDDTWGQIVRQIIIPSWLHEAFGEEQSLLSLAAVTSFGLLATLIVFMFDPVLQALAPWRTFLAAVLVFDIAAGCIANFTPGTKRYYAQRPRGRWLFIAVHIHLPLVGILMDFPMAPTFAIWAWTIAAAALINAMRNHPLQAMVGGLAVGLGLTVTPLIVSASLALLIVGPLFLFKVAYAFAVDQSRPE